DKYCLYGTHKIKTDNSELYYLFRKFVAEGPNEVPDRSYSPIDMPLIRYADILLNLAEAYNEMGGADNMKKAIDCVNLVRERAGVALLNSNANTQVAGQDDLRERIRNERRWEFNGEGINFFDEMRWGTWKQSKFFNGSGLKQVWGELEYDYDWYRDFLYTWPVPRKEREMNPNLTLDPS
ncbi:MAG: RagB/SusD family nutrient uptake outer membrane protein, partial [Bacteroides sp.]|nr:RagB/SusD family nutrient uptake outer membrane protein [Bacteroides sp.]